MYTIAMIASDQPLLLEGEAVLLTPAAALKAA